MDTMTNIIIIFVSSQIENHNYGWELRAVFQYSYICRYHIPARNEGFIIVAQIYVYLAVKLTGNAEGLAGFDLSS